MPPRGRGLVVEIEGKVAIVTGAASGIGRATAIALAAEGASVVVADVDAEGGAATVGEITGADGSATFVACDVTSPDSVRNLFAEAEEAYGGVDIVYNNAGISSGEPHWPDANLERIAEETHINTSGVMMGTREAIQAMRKRGGGVIVNTASIAGDGHLPFDPMYSATKKAVMSFTQSCAPLAESENIRVNAVSPGMVRSAFQRKTGDGTRPASWLRPSIERHGDSILPPEAIAEAVLDFIKDDSKAGEVRTVSGG